MPGATPRVQTGDRNFDQAQSNTVTKLNQIAAIPILSGQILSKVSLSAGANAPNTNLNRALIGWFPIRFHGAWAQIYDTQDSNQNPTQTLQLVASAPVVVDLWVF